MNIFETVQSIIRDVIDDNSLVLSMDTTSDEIVGWDSLVQINIVAIIESEFHIKFDLNEITKLRSIRNIVDMIERKQKH